MAEDGATGWSVMGTETIATERMVAAIRTVGQEPLWVVSRSGNDAGAFARDLDIPGSTTDLMRVLDDPSIAFAYVSARVERRLRYVAASLHARVHVLCDGPVAPSAEAAAELVALGQSTGTVLAVNQPFRASAVHQTMRRLISEREVGAVRSVVLVRGRPYEPPSSRRSDGLPKAGQIYLDACVDGIDLARFLTGAEPVEASAVSNEPDASPDHLTYTIRMSDGCLFQAHESFAIAEMDSLLLVAGEKGILTANGTLNGRASGTLSRRIGGRTELVPVRDREGDLSTVADFLNRVGGRVSWVSTGFDNVAALRAVEAVQKAANTGLRVPIGETPPAKVLGAGQASVLPEKKRSAEPPGTTNGSGRRSPGNLGGAPETMERKK